MAPRAASPAAASATVSACGRPPGIVRQLESLGEGEVATATIGELVMEALKNLDDVAYVRFASVYRTFREARDFEELLGELASGDEAAPAVAGRKAPRDTP